VISSRSNFRPGLIQKNAGPNRPLTLDGPECVQVTDTPCQAIEAAYGSMKSSDSQLLAALLAVRLRASVRSHPLEGFSLDKSGSVVLTVTDPTSAITGTTLVFTTCDLMLYACIRSSNRIQKRIDEKLDTEVQKRKPDNIF
jgi:hypothetical protein